MHQEINESMDEIIDYVNQWAENYELKLTGKEVVSKQLQEQGVLSLDVLRANLDYGTNVNFIDDLTQVLISHVAKHLFEYHGKLISFDLACNSKNLLYIVEIQEVNFFVTTNPHCYQLYQQMRTEFFIKK